MCCMQDAGFQQAFDAIRVKFKPTAKDMQVAEESGTDLAQTVLKKVKAQQRKAQAGASQARAAGTPPLRHFGFLDNIPYAIISQHQMLCAVPCAN